MVDYPIFLNCRERKGWRRYWTINVKKKTCAWLVAEDSNPRSSAQAKERALVWRKPDTKAPATLEPERLENIGNKNFSRKDAKAPTVFLLCLCAFA